MQFLRLVLSQETVFYSAKSRDLRRRLRSPAASSAVFQRAIDGLFAGVQPRLLVRSAVFATAGGAFWHHGSSLSAVLPCIAGLTFCNHFHRCRRHSVTSVVMPSAARAAPKCLVLCHKSLFFVISLSVSENNLYICSRLRRVADVSSAGVEAAAKQIFALRREEH